MLLTVYVDACTTKFYFCELFLAVPFFAQSDSFWDGLGGMDVTDVPSRKAVLEETCLAWSLNLTSCFCFVRASKPIINQLTWPIPRICLGSLSAQRLRMHIKGTILESSGSWAQLCRKYFFRILDKNFPPLMIGVQRYAGLSLEVLKRLACSCTKLANLLPEGSWKKTPQLVNVLVELPSRRRGSLKSAIPPHV